MSQSRSIPHPADVLIVRLPTPLDEDALTPHERPTPSDHAILAAEHHNPEGPAPTPHEREIVPALTVILAAAGLVIIPVILGITDGPRAAFVSAVLVLLGYGTAWSVVWAAGLMRVKDEQDAEVQVILGDWGHHRRKHSPAESD